MGCSPRAYRNRFVILGTFVEVLCEDKKAAGIVYQEFKRLEKVFNFYDPDSEISRLNSSNSCQNVSQELIEVILLSQQLCQMSLGAFDISAGSLYEFWKEKITEKEVKTFPTLEEVLKIKEQSGMEFIKVDREKQTVCIDRKGVKIDLGAIAKGYIVDCAVKKLKENGVNNALINAGGDIYCLGEKEGVPWRVGIRSPQNQVSLSTVNILETESLVDEAVATSGTYEQCFNYQGKRYSHLIDPRTGYPVDTNIVSVTVITKNCVSADSLATAFFIMGIEGIKNFLEKYPSTMRIYVVTIDQDGKQKIHYFT